MREERREEEEAALWHLMVFKLYSSIFMLWKLVDDILTY
jgi:hypothetical protein